MQFPFGLLFSQSFEANEVGEEKMDQLNSGGVRVGAIEHKAYARVGLLGNPSDVYYGRTISFSLANFWASVKLEPSDDLVIKPHPVHDLVQFQSLHHLVPFFFSPKFLIFY